MTVWGDLRVHQRRETTQHIVEAGWGLKARRVQCFNVIFFTLDNSSVTSVSYNTLSKQEINFFFFLPSHNKIIYHAKLFIYLFRFFFFCHFFKLIIKNIPATLCWWWLYVSGTECNDLADHFRCLESSSSSSAWCPSSPRKCTFSYLSRYLQHKNNLKN